MNDIVILFIQSNILNRKDQQYRRRLHQVLIKGNDQMRERASTLEVGVMVSIHGFLKTESARIKDDKHRSVYYICAEKLIVNQPKAALAETIESDV